MKRLDSEQSCTTEPTVKTKEKGLEDRKSAAYEKEMLRLFDEQKAIEKFLFVLTRRVEIAKEMLKFTIKKREAYGKEVVSQAEAVGYDPNHKISYFWLRYIIENVKRYYAYSKAVGNFSFFFYLNHWNWHGDRPPGISISVHPIIMRPNEFKLLYWTRERLKQVIRAQS